MNFFVYIIYSSKFNIFYKGITKNPKYRLFQHNYGFSKYTKNKGPWTMVYLEVCPDKKTALIREKQIKKYNQNCIKKLNFYFYVQ